MSDAEADFLALRRNGMTLREAAKAVNRSVGWASQIDIPYLARPTSLHPDAERGLEDFEFFRRCYLGHPSMPWQLEAAELAVRAWENPDKQFLLMNCPSGVGKTTLMMDFGIWLTVRARWKSEVLRGLYVSWVASTAEEAVGVIRRFLELTEPAVADQELLAKGAEVEAWRCLASDFGSFKPLSRTQSWKSVSFEIQYYDGFVPTKKEPTWSSYGQGAGVLGKRFNAQLLDDLVTEESVGTPQAIAKQRKMLDGTLESRLEPRGLFWFNGQRIGAGDTYQYAREKVELDEETDREKPKYKHILFPAHFDELCQGNHAKDTAREWPYGCLLDPFRLPWTGSGGLDQVRRNNPQVFEVWYQQRDGDPDGGLVRDVWLTGGVDHHDSGRVVPGCWDLDRCLGELPANVRGPVRVGTVDPSGTKHWAVNDWLASTEAPTTWLVDAFDGRMTADELLDWDEQQGEFKGLMHRWQLRSIDQGVPIRTWVVEQNAAQRYLLAYDHVKRWARRYEVTILPHNTTAKNKLDAELGPQVLREPHRTGLVRYPRGDMRSVGRVEVIRQQLTTFPNPAFRSDQVMAQWFFRFHLPTLMPRSKPLPTLSRPSWLSGSRVRRTA